MKNFTVKGTTEYTKFWPLLFWWIFDSQLDMLMNTEMVTIVTVKKNQRFIKQ